MPHQTSPKSWLADLRVYPRHYCEVSYNRGVDILGKTSEKSNICQGVRNSKMNLRDRWATYNSTGYLHASCSQSPTPAAPQCSLACKIPIKDGCSSSDGIFQLDCYVRLCSFAKYGFRIIDQAAIIIVRCVYLTWQPSWV